MKDETKKLDAARAATATTRRALKVAEVAALLSVSEKTVKRLVQRGRIRRIKGIRHIIIPATELEKLLAE